MIFSTNKYFTRTFTYSRRRNYHHCTSSIERDLKKCLLLLGACQPNTYYYYCIWLFSILGETLGMYFGFITMMLCPNTRSRPEGSIRCVGTWYFFCRYFFVWLLFIYRRFSETEKKFAKNFNRDRTVNRFREHEIIFTRFYLNWSIVVHSIDIFYRSYSTCILL